MPSALTEYKKTETKGRVAERTSFIPILKHHYHSKLALIKLVEDRRIRLDGAIVDVAPPGVWKEFPVAERRLFGRILGVSLPMSFCFDCS